MTTVRNLVLASIGILSVRVPASPEFVVVLVIIHVAPPEIELSVPLLPPMTSVLVLSWESALSALAMISAPLVSPLFPGLFPYRTPILVLVRWRIRLAALLPVKNLAMSRVTMLLKLLTLLTRLLAVLWTVRRELKRLVSNVVVPLLTPWTLNVNTSPLRPPRPEVLTVRSRPPVSPLPNPLSASSRLTAKLQRLVVERISFPLISRAVITAFRLLTLTVLSDVKRTTPWSVRVGYLGPI